MIIIWGREVKLNDGRELVVNLAPRSIWFMPRVCVCVCAKMNVNHLHG